MSIFTEAEIAYLRSQFLGRLATIGRDGQPHVIPMTFEFNAAEDAIDIGGIAFTRGKKWRDMQHNQKVTFLVDDFADRAGHAVEVRDTVEIHQAGGSKINPRIEGFDEPFVRLRPSFIVSWGVDGSGGGGPADFRPNARRVG